jgi:hypothetical protein
VRAIVAATPRIVDTLAAALSSPLLASSGDVILRVLQTLINLAAEDVGLVHIIGHQACATQLLNAVVSQLVFGHSRATARDLAGFAVPAERGAAWPPATSPHGEAAVQLLCNLTRLPGGAAALVHAGDGRLLQLAVTAFVAAALPGRAAPHLDRLAYVLANVSSCAPGRAWLLAEDRAVLPRLLSWTVDASESRREGTVQMLRNCCFETSKHRCVCLVC